MIRTSNELSGRFTTLGDTYFTYNEFACKCDHCKHLRQHDADMGEWFSTPEFVSFMEVLVSLRQDLDFPFIINSGYRCPDYNDSLYNSDGKHLDGPHTKGAADISICFERMYRLVDVATTRELGVGIKQHGPREKRFIHIDNLGGRLWTYP